MTKRIGIIQTRGIGDIIIALPIADYFLEQGYEVRWPIDETFLPMFQRAKRAVKFLGVPRRSVNDYDYFFNEPLSMLQDARCDRITVLYSHLGGLNIPDLRLAASLKFDEYKYAIAGVPFERKWHLNYERDLEREESLFKSLNIEGEYACVHGQGSTMEDSIAIPSDLTRGLQVVQLSPLTDSVFDWRLTLERASKLIMVDSCFANLIEQLNLENDKAIFLQWPVAFTPVFANGWRFLFPPAKAT